MQDKKRFYPLPVSSRLVFVTFIIVLTQTLLFVWLFDLGKHKRWFEHSLEAQLTLSFALFVFLFFALYKGVKLKEDIGRIWKKPEIAGDTGLELFAEIVPTSIEVSGSIFDFLIALILIPLAIVVAFYLFALATSGILLFFAVLYWVFYRAIRFALKKSKVCQHSITKSLQYSLLFTVLYTVWFYLISLALYYCI
jgi:hypothetical protein